MYVRGIVQNVRTNNNQELFLNSIDQHSGNVTSSLFFAYKLNWQTVLFVGLGDERDVDVADNKLASRQLFIKMSYAFQR